MRNKVVVILLRIYCLSVFYKFFLLLYYPTALGNRNKLYYYTSILSPPLPLKPLLFQSKLGLDKIHLDNH